MYPVYDFMIIIIMCVYVCDVIRLVHSGCLRLWEGSAGDGRIQGEGEHHFVDTRYIRYVWSSGIWSSRRQMVGRLAVHLKRSDHHGGTTHMSRLRHFLLRVNLRLRRFLQHLYRWVYSCIVLVTHADDSCGSKAFIGACLSVCLWFCLFVHSITR